MKYTLLQLTQTVLSSMDSDEINSINDTVESQQVVKIIKTCYGDIFSRGNVPENYTIFQLTASGSSSYPTIMTLPTDAVKNCLWVKYDCRQTGETDTHFLPVERVSLEEFLNRMHAYAPSADTASLQTFNYTIDGTSFQFIVDKVTAPTYYTTWDDSTFLFNSYDSVVDTTLQSSKTMCYGERQPPWTESDSFVPSLDDHQLLIHEAKALAWAEMRQLTHPRAERSARQEWVSFARTKHKILDGDDYQTWTPHYGRKR
jgi:hypothetical protein